MNFALQTHNITKHYGKIAAVDNLSLEIPEGEIFGFLGPNGAGKTTSIRIICGLLKPDSGCVLIWGKKIGCGDPTVQSLVGICPQEIILWERLTCIEQLQFIGEMYGIPARQGRFRGLQLLKDLNLEAQKDQQSRHLSGGMKRRLNLLMALVHDPEILVLDEPEAGLDPQSRVLVREYIRSMAQKKTIILTTHNMDEADRMADRVAIIDHGSLLVVDTPQGLKHRLGEGQVLEIALTAKEGQPQDLISQIDSMCREIEPAEIQAQINPHSRCLEIRSANPLLALPGVISWLERREIGYGEVRLRETTLEDVFIQLTGRRLRE